MNIAIIGMGNMGSRYARMICDDIIKDVKLVAVTRISADKKELLVRLECDKIPVFDSADALFDKIEKGELKADAVIIATPHYSHEEIAKRALKTDFMCSVRRLPVSTAVRPGLWRKVLKNQAVFSE